MLRTTQGLGPSHTIDLNGIATTVRIPIWNCFDDGNHVVYSASVIRDEYLAAVRAADETRATKVFERATKQLVIPASF